MTATEGIRKHRAKLRAEQCSRLDSATRQNQRTGDLGGVQDVLEQHLLTSDGGRAIVGDVVKNWEQRKCH